MYQAHVCGSRRIPLWLKVAYTAFVAVLVPFYWWEYGPTNFLYFCDMALLITVPALWMESPLLVSMPAVGILLPQALWMMDFLGTCAGFELTGLTDYMFDPRKDLFTRGLSFFHFWLPLLLLWLLWRLGYDRKALVGWTLLACTVMVICYILLPGPPAPADNPNMPVNINYVYGLSDEKPQSWMPGFTYFLLMMMGLPVGIFLPTHVLLSRIFKTPPRM